ncbi:MAG: hypothetical protein RL308_1472 [Bacteroidota bacterium]|jgi:hypothetical protein
MIIKKGDIQHRLNLFIQLEKYNETVSSDKKVCPYEVLVNISYLEPLLMKIDQDRLELIESLSDGFIYVYDSDGSVGKLKEGDLLDGEIESKLSPSSMPTFRSKYLDLLNEEIDIKICKFDSIELRRLVKEELIDNVSIMALSCLGYIKEEE